MPMTHFKLVWFKGTSLNPPKMTSQPWVKIRFPGEHPNLHQNRSQNGFDPRPCGFHGAQGSGWAWIVNEGEQSHGWAGATECPEIGPKGSRGVQRKDPIHVDWFGFGVEVLLGGKWGLLCPLNKSKPHRLNLAEMVWWSGFPI